MAKLESSLILSLIDRVSAPARQVSATVSRLNDAAAANRRAISEMQGQMLGAVGAGYALYRGLSAPVGAAIGFESAMADIAKVTDFNAEGLSAYGKELRALATSEIPMAVTELAALSENAAAAGIAQEDLLDFTRLTAKAALAWGIGGAEAGQDLANIKTALRLTIGETERYADAINHLADNTASNAPSLITFSKEVAVQGEFFGFTKEQTLAFGSAMISAGAEANVASTSFRNMGRALTKGASSTKRQQDAFRKLGMNARKVAGAMQKDAVGTTLEVIEAIGRLPAEMQAAAISDLFGDEARALIPLLGNTEALREALGFVSDEMTYAGSVGAEFEKRAATTEFAIQRFKNQVNDLGIIIGSILLPPLNEILATIGPIVTRISEFAEANPELTRNVIAASAALIGFRVAMVGLKFVGLLGKGGMLDLMALGFRGVVEPAKNAGKAVSSMIAYQSALAAMSGAKYGGFAKVVDGAKALAMAAPGMGIAKAVLAAIGTALGAITLPVAAGIVAVASAGVLIYKYWDRIASFVSGFASAIGEELRPVLEAAQPMIEWFSPLGESIASGWEQAKSALSGVGDLIGNLFTQEQLTDEQKAGFEQSGGQLARSLIDGIKQGFADLSWNNMFSIRIEEGSLAAKGLAAGQQLVDGIVDAFANIGQMLSDAITSFDWVQTGIDLMNAIWEGMKSIIPNMVAGLGSAISGLNPFAGGEAQGGPQQRLVQPGDTTPGGQRIGGAFAKGGRFNSGLALVGEEGPELVEFGGPGEVHTARQTRGILSGAQGGAGGVTISAPLIGSVQITNEADADAMIAYLDRQLRDMFSALQVDTGHRIA
ncbi:phage tail tape measure protein [Devosia sp. SD17-2]|uniref:phage tail tape measure protein n=1 Tax=Devosia sp. SD17-2 TaxID=2976459 RepID=UPI0023D8586B|nr:phage tail tape measure protein [Devosia sp. SD17-2]WEJ33853.1 phage tail tape measure protein [Devosia sp. SD17-2]